MTSHSNSEQSGKPEPARGKNVTSRYMETTRTATARSRATSASRSTSSSHIPTPTDAPTSVNRSLTERTRVKATPLATSAEVSQTAGNRAKATDAVVPPKPPQTGPVTKPSRSVSGPSTTVSKVVPSKLDPVTEAPVPVPSLNGDALGPTPPVSLQPTSSTTIDTLQIAAQLYPWIYMSTSLSTALQVAESSAKTALENKEKELENDEADISDQLVRYETERLVAFYDELSTEKFRTQAPSIMRTFLRHGDECMHATGCALQLSQQTENQIFDYESPTQIYDDALVKLDELHAEATNLESSINQLQPSNALEIDQHSLVLSVFSSCLPVIRARISNISMAQELVQSSKENTALALQMESLGL